MDRDGFEHKLDLILKAVKKDVSFSSIVKRIQDTERVRQIYENEKKNKDVDIVSELAIANSEYTMKVVKETILRLKNEGLI